MFASLIVARKKPRRCYQEFFLVFPVTALFVLGFLFLAPVLGPSQARAFANPHGNFSSSTSFCMLCHAAHEATGEKLVKGVPESALCFTCHNGTGSNYDIQMQMNQDPASNSMHPIDVSLPANSGVYSYIPNTTAGIAPAGPFGCSSCHNPHGNTGNTWLLRGSYDINEYVTFATSPNPYNACWTCHNSTMVVNDISLFPKHNRHIVEMQSPCTACHFSPHGVSHTELVKFNPMFVGASLSAGIGPQFIDGGANTGSCTLTCHGADHNSYSY